MHIHRRCRRRCSWQNLPSVRTKRSYMYAYELNARIYTCTQASEHEMLLAELAFSPPEQLPRLGISILYIYI
jgi:hypothetical protein